MDIKAFLVHRPLPPKAKQDLISLAQQPTDNVWQPGTPLTQVRHCHYSNSPDEMKYALSHDYNFMEGDVRLEAGVRRLPVVDRWREPIMGHDPDDVQGLTLDEWLAIGKESDRGLKLDIKQAAALPKILDCVKAHHIPDEFLIFNGDITRGPGAPSKISLTAGNIAMDMTMDVKDVQQIRRQFPNSLISLGAYTGAQPAGTCYSQEQIERLSHFADQVGGPISFPLRAEFVTPEIVQSLKEHGHVSIWNDPSSWSPADLKAEEQRFRDMGVDGMIDLRNTPHPRG